MDPQLADAHFNLARLYERAQDPKASLRHLLAYRRMMDGKAPDMQAGAHRLSSQARLLENRRTLRPRSKVAPSAAPAIRRTEARGQTAALRFASGMERRIHILGSCARPVARSRRETSRRGSGGSSARLRRFRGHDSAGEYGGGTVHVWDRGYWSPEGNKTTEEALQAGDLKFTLEGEKLKGSWVLVRMRGDHFGGKRINWLLIKHRDAASSGASGAMRCSRRIARSPRAEACSKSLKARASDLKPFMLATASRREPMPCGTAKAQSERKNGPSRKMAAPEAVVKSARAGEAKARARQAGDGESAAQFHRAAIGQAG